MKKKRSFPNTYVIIAGLMVVCAVLTWVVPGGRYVAGDDGVMRFNEVEAVPQTWQIFSALFDGFVKQAGIIVFILIVGGAFQLLNSTGAVDIGIRSFIKNIGNRRALVLILLSLLFSTAGAVFGMSEEVIPFVGLLVPLMLSMGYDKMTALLVVYVASNIGFSAAFLNPFTVGIAQEMAGLPLFSGMGYRVVCWTLMTIVTIVFILVYASGVKKKNSGKETASASIRTETGGEPERNVRHYIVLGILGATMVMLIIGVIHYKWYLSEISALFLFMGILCGAVGGMGANKIVSEFMTGAKDILSAALVVGFASGLVVILQNGNVMDSILNSAQQALGNSSETGSLTAMYGIQAFINLFIPSATAKAAITIPIMAPFSDMIGVSRQAMVLAFQFGDGFTNMVTPTSGVLMAALAMAKVEYSEWVKFIWKWVVALMVIGLLLLIGTTFAW